MRDLNTAICRVRQEEARWDRTCEQAREVREAQKDERIDKITEEQAWGEHDADMAGDFDPAMLMRVARLFATVDFELAYSRCSDDLLHIQRVMKDYAKDLADVQLD